MTLKFKLPEITDAKEPAPFPDVKHGRRPLGYMILVQHKYRPKFKILANGQKLHLTDTTVDVNRYTGDVAKIVAIGPMAWRNHQDNSWIDGVTCSMPKIGDLVQVPSVGGKSFWVDLDGEREAIEFNYLRDVDVLGIVEDDSVQTTMGA